MKITANTNKVLSIIFGNGGTVFGGFVRDMLIDETPKDIDIEIDNPMSLVIKLANLGKVEVIGASGYKDKGIKARLICDAGPYEELILDINQSNIRHMADVDVNRLVMDGYYIRLSNGTFSQNNIHEVLDHISKRIFDTEFGCKQKRIDHMIDKGWTWLNRPKPSIDVNPIHQVELSTTEPILIDLICDVCRECGKIPAIKTARALTGCGLKEGKDAVEHWKEERGFEIGNGGFSSLREFFDQHTEYLDLLKTYPFSVRSGLTR